MVLDWQRLRSEVERVHRRYQIEVVDLLEHPHLARGNQIVALPTLVVNLPEPVRQIIGDLSNTDRVLVGMALQKIGASKQ